MPVPGRVDAALQFVRLADSFKNPPPTFDGIKIESRELTGVEVAVEGAALNVLLDYFQCKADFGDDPKCKSNESEELKELKNRVDTLESGGLATPITHKA